MPPPLALDKPPVAVDLTWDPAEIQGIQTYRVRRELPDGAGWQIEGETPGAVFTVRNLAPDRTVRFAVCPVFSDGTEPPEESWEKVVVTPTPANRPPLPATPTGLAVVQHAGTLEFAWDVPTDGVTVHVEVRMSGSGGGSWKDSILIARVPAVVGAFRWPWIHSGQVTFFARGVDYHGRFSAAGDSLGFNISAMEDHVLANTEDESGGGFAGTKAGTEVDGGNLRLATVPATAADWTDPAEDYDFPAAASYVAEGTYETAAYDNGQRETARLECEIAVTTPVGAAGGLQGLAAEDWTFRIHGREEAPDGTPFDRGIRGLLDKWTADGSTTLYPCDVTIEIAISESNTATLGSVTWQAWRPFVAGDYYHRWRKFRVTLRGDGLHFPRLTTLKFHRRRRNRKDEGIKTLDGLGPVTVTLTTPFIAAPAVTANVDGALAGLGESIEITNRTATSFDVEVFDALGVSLACDVGWHAMGV